MSFQIKRSNKSVVVVERWYDDGKQKEKHIMTVEPYTTGERLNALQIEFRRSKGKMPAKTRKDLKDKQVRLSDKDISVIKESFQGSKSDTLEPDEIKTRKEVLDRIIEKPLKRTSKQTPRAFAKKYKLKSSDK